MLFEKMKRNRDIGLISNIDLIKSSTIVKTFK